MASRCCLCHNLIHNWGSLMSYLAASVLSYCVFSYPDTILLWIRFCKLHQWWYGLLMKIGLILFFWKKARPGFKKSCAPKVHLNQEREVCPASNFIGCIADFPLFCQEGFHMAIKFTCFYYFGGRRMPVYLLLWSSMAVHRLPLGASGNRKTWTCCWHCCPLAALFNMNSDWLFIPSCTILGPSSLLPTCQLGYF